MVSAQVARGRAVGRAARLRETNARVHHAAIRVGRGADLIRVIRTERAVVAGDASWRTAIEAGDEQVPATTALAVPGEITEENPVATSRLDAVAVVSRHRIALIITETALDPEIVSFGLDRRDLDAVCEMTGNLQAPDSSTAVNSELNGIRARIGDGDAN